MWRSLRNGKLIAQAEQLARADVDAPQPIREAKREAAGVAGGGWALESRVRAIDRLRQTSAQQNILNISMIVQSAAAAGGAIRAMGTASRATTKIVIHLILQSLALLAAICIW
jgi:hypothetical protein